MAHESGQPQQRPVKRVVKRVVKKPVAKPAPQPVTTPAAAKAPVAASAPRTRLRDRFERPTLVRPRMPDAPAVAPAAATALSGLVTGAFAVGATVLTMMLLDLLLGTSAGGGWGLLALVAIVAAAILLGDRLLGWLGVPDSRATSFVGVLIVLAVILGLLLDLALTGWAVLFVPLLGAVSFTVVNALITRLAPPSEA